MIPKLTKLEHTKESLTFQFFPKNFRFHTGADLGFFIDGGGGGGFSKKFQKLCRIFFKSTKMIV